jgi:hypothetical protein
VIFLLLSIQLAFADSSLQLRSKLENTFSISSKDIDEKIFQEKNRALWLEVVQKIKYPRKISKLKNQPFPVPELAKNLPDMYLNKISTPEALYIAELSAKPSEEPAIKEFQTNSRALVKDKKNYDSLFESACRERADFRKQRVENEFIRLTVMNVRGACIPVFLAELSIARAVNFFDQKSERLILEGDGLYSPTGGECQLNPAPPVNFAEEKDLKSKILIAIVDSGVDYNHLGLVGGMQFSEKTKGEIQFLLQNFLQGVVSERLKQSFQRFLKQPERLQGMGWDFLINTNFPMDYFENQSNSEGWMRIGEGHGSHVAGLARGNQAKFEILPIRMIGNSRVKMHGKAIPKDPYALAYDSITLANLRGARVASISMEGFSERGQGFVDAILDHPDLLVIAAAGNGGIEITKYANPLQSFLAPNLIQVAGLDANEESIHKISNFSSSYVDIAVASEDIESCTVGGGSGPMTGTSMAAPRVANLVATLFSINPNLRAEQAKEIICKTADQTVNTKTKVKCGIMNPKRAIEFVLEDLKK